MARATRPGPVAVAVNEIPPDFLLFGWNAEQGKMFQGVDEAARHMRNFFGRAGEEFVTLAWTLEEPCEKAIVELTRAHNRFAVFLTRDHYVSLCKKADGWEIGVNWRGSKGARFFDQHVSAEQIGPILRSNLEFTAKELRARQS